jgi:hypothetical protein
MTIDRATYLKVACFFEFSGSAQLKWSVYKERSKPAAAIVTLGSAPWFAQDRQLRQAGGPTSVGEDLT